MLQAELEALKQSHRVTVDDLKAKVDALQAKNESLKREIKGLNSALQWANDTEEMPRERWLERGHSEEYADAMENLFVDMKRIIEYLRIGTVNDNETGKNRIEIDFDLEDEDGNLTRAEHDQSLLPYWEEFSAALRHWSEYHADSKYRDVCILNVELPKGVLDILRPAFEKSGIKGISFVNSCRHTGEMVDFVKKVLQTNHFITSVCLDEINFTREDVKAICGAIKSRNAEGRFIDRLILQNCFQDGIDSRTLKRILTSITAGSTKNAVLYLDENKMSSREAGVISEFLHSNPCLTRLDLGVNYFDDADAAVLANALSSNTHLRRISFNGNEIRESGRENGRLAFLRAIFDVSSLLSCATSNHTCSFHWLLRDISVLNSNECATVNKWTKIVVMLALSGEDSFINTSLLRGVPAQLIPLILHRIVNAGCTGNNNRRLTDLYLELTNATRCQRHDVWDNLGKRKSLNCMYSLMRNWVVPSIFV